MKVYKYTALLTDLVLIHLPAGAEILHIDHQGREDNGEVSIWALVDPDLPLCDRFVRIAGTGHPIVGDGGVLKYINTFTMMDRSLWFHAFELLEKY